MKTSNLTLRLDPDVKEQADRLFESCGMNLTTAIKVFISQSLWEQGMPFEITRKATPNRETLEAMAEAEALLRDPKAPRVTSAKQLFALLDAEDEHA